MCRIVGKSPNKRNYNNIVGKLLPDKSNNRVHLIYLPLLRDLLRVHKYNWGSACLANLYREMCRATKPNAKAMGGFDGLPTYPFALRWGYTQLNFQGITCGDLTEYRLRLDHMNANDLPYETYNNNLSCEVQQDKKICHNHLRILMPYIELINGVIKTQIELPSMHNGLNIGVIIGIKSYNDLKSNILSTHNII
ncbi:hypothetical protein Lal_00008220 [Lupinus albus]|nr:hypothetical protein Lal_00008220 [Lupinus albus]